MPIQQPDLKSNFFSSVLKTPIWLVHLAANQSSANQSSANEQT